MQPRSRNVAAALWCALFLALTVDAQEIRVTTVGRDGTLTWTNSLTNGSSTILFSTNLGVGPWLPNRHVFTTGAVSSVAVVSPRPPIAFYRILGVDTSNVPSGMTQIPAGVFQMGDNYDEGVAAEWPVHGVYVSSFYMDRFEITNERLRLVYQWAYDHGLIGATSTTVTNREGTFRELLDLDGNDHGYPLTRIAFTNGLFIVTSNQESFPASGVTWYGAQAYCNYRSDMEGLARSVNFTNWGCDFAAVGYRLPTEAEWEKAARGGMTGQHFPWPSYGGAYSAHINSGLAKYDSTRDPFFYQGYQTTPVGYFDGNQLNFGLPVRTNMINGFGLYDMAGNVWEWCWDVWKGDWYSQLAAIQDDPRGPTVAANAVPVTPRSIRGGSYGYTSWYLRTACRHTHGYNPSYASAVLGFRCVRRL